MVFILKNQHLGEYSFFKKSMKEQIIADQFDSVTTIPMQGNLVLIPSIIILYVMFQQFNL